VKRPTLKAFLAMSYGEVLDDPSVYWDLELLIAEWATGKEPTRGQLPDVSGRNFASWLDDMWEDRTEEPDVPVQKILECAVSEWCGGRTF